MATYVKGDKVANATSYELLEKVGSSYNSLKTGPEINFNVSELGLAEGNHTLVVKAKASGYTDSDYSNEVIFAVSASGGSGGDTGGDTGGDSGGTTTPTKYTLTINPTPSNATVTLNGVTQKSITVNSGTSVTWKVSASGYAEKSGTYKVTSDYTMSVELVADSGSGGGTGEKTTANITTGAYIAIADGAVTSSASWRYTDLVAIDRLVNNDSGKCTSNLQGHAKVANIAFYSSADLSTYISGVQVTASATQQYTAEEIKAAAPAGATYVNFSTHGTQAPLEVTIMQ